MADPTPTPTPTPTPSPKTPGKRGEIDQSWLDEFTTAEAILAAAKPADRAATLAAGGIDTAKTDALAQAIVAARKLAGQAVQDTTGKHIITGNEDDLKKELLKQIQYIQTRARQKYDATEPGRLADFGISHPISNSRSLLEQAGDNILLKLNGDPAAVPPVPPDVLPGVNRCLEMSPLYLHSRVLKGLTTWDVDRRESEWDDHGETYPMTQDGPHILCSLNIPAGLFYLSLYEIDPNGHGGDNRFRDYQISVRPHPGRASLDEHDGYATILNSFHDLALFDEMPELARARANDFYGGVYKRFLVRGPTKLTFQVNRNYSFNTILAGVMLDLVDELPPPYYCTRQEWEAAQQQKEAQAKSQSVFIPAGTAAEAAQRLASALEGMPFKNEAWWAENKRRMYLPLLRWQLAQTSQDDSPALASSYYQLNRFSDWEDWLQDQGVVTAREIEKALRWDGVTDYYAGLGYKMISDYVRTNQISREK